MVDHGLVRLLERKSQVALFLRIRFHGPGGEGFSLHLDDFATSGKRQAEGRGLSLENLYFRFRIGVDLTAGDDHGAFDRGRVEERRLGQFAASLDDDLSGSVLTDTRSDRSFAVLFLRKKRGSEQEKEQGKFLHGK